MTAAVRYDHAGLGCGIAVPRYDHFFRGERLYTLDGDECCLACIVENEPDALEPGLDTYDAIDRMKVGETLNLGGGAFADAILRREQ